MKHSFSTTMTALLLITACSGGNKNEWDKLDYSNVYRKAAQRDNDTRYSAPTVVGCLDEDLYNCSR
jgi:hypothetical protein